MASDAHLQELTLKVPEGRDIHGQRWRRAPHDYTIEVCVRCGAQLDRSGNGRCPVDRRHWEGGGIILRLVARPVDEQDDITARYYERVIPKAARSR